MKIPIPSTIEDVTAELCREVFEKICGGEISDPYIDKPLQEEAEIWRFSGNSNREPMILATRLSCFPFFNPFTRIQDTILCMPWVVENKLEWNIFSHIIDCKVIWGVDIWHDGDVICSASAETEEMARMVAIIKAYNKIEEMRK